MRERPGDIPELVGHFTALLTERIGRPLARVTREAMDALVRHPWPGNVRELANIVERLVILAPHPTIGAEDVAAALPPHADHALPLPAPRRGTWRSWRNSTATRRRSSRGRCRPPTGTSPRRRGGSRPTGRISTAG